MSTNDLHRYNGVLLDLSHDSIGEEIREAVNEDWYEAHEAALVQDYLPSSIDVIEAGAGIGYVSCVIDRVVADSTTHVALEPNPAISPVLERTKRLNGANYITCERAYSSTTESVELTQKGDFWTATTHSNQEGPISISTTSLEDICELYEISTFSLVIDIEGAEYELLSTELTLLENRCPLLIVEFHEYGPYSEEYDDDLEDSSFELVDGIENVCIYRNTEFEDSSDNFTN